jgi:hypothetical protein
MKRRRNKNAHANGNRQADNKARTFSQLFHDVRDKWEGLSPAAKIIYIAICFRYKGNNNGEIHFGYRDAQKLCKCAAKTVQKAFVELQEHGLIVRTREGKFRSEELFNPASEWAVSAYPEARKKGSKRERPRFPGKALASASLGKHYRFS